MSTLPRSTMMPLLLTTAVVGLVALFAWLRITGPSDGTRMDLASNQVVWTADGVRVTPWHETSSGLHHDDVVIAVAGRSIESWARSLITPSDWRQPGAVGQTITYTVLRHGERVDVPVRLTSYPTGAFLRQRGSASASLLLFLVVAGFVYFRRPGEPAALPLLLAAVGTLASVPYFFGLQVNDLTGGVGFWLMTMTDTGYLLFSIALLHFWLVFPRPQGLVNDAGRLVPCLYLVPFTVDAIAVLALGFREQRTLVWIYRAGFVTGTTALLMFGAAVVAGVSGYRSASTGADRQKVRWVALGALVSVAGIFLSLMLPSTMRPQALAFLLGVPIPLSVAIAILRYRLFDIDLILARTLVFGTLTAIVVGTYVFVVTTLGALFRVNDNLLVSLLATGVIAVIVQPLRQRVQGTVHRIVYGERDDPYVALSRLGHRLEGQLSSDAVLPTIVETIAQALRLPYVALVLNGAKDCDAAAIHGTPMTGPIRVPLVYGTDTVGELLLAPRHPREPLSTADRRLLDDLARQAGIAVHAVRLAADLQLARERLISAREEERRHLRNDLHDGLGPVLSGLTLKIETARNLLAHDPAADALLAEMTARTQDAVADIRRLVYALRPPALDELGLVSALREAGAQTESTIGGGPKITIEAPVPLPPLPAAVEVAAFRIAQEAVTNVTRHARATHCVVRLALDNGLLVTVEDDGIGLEANHRSGVGFASMRERAEELGGSFTVASVPTGGTRIQALLPLPPLAPGSTRWPVEPTADQPAEE